MRYLLDTHAFLWHCIDYSLPGTFVSSFCTNVSRETSEGKVGNEHSPLSLWERAGVRAVSFSQNSPLTLTLSQRERGRSFHYFAILVPAFLSPDLHYLPTLHHLTYTPPPSSTHNATTYAA